MEVEELDKARAFSSNWRYSLASYRVEFLLLGLLRLRRASTPLTDGITAVEISEQSKGLL